MVYNRKDFLSTMATLSTGVLLSDSLLSCANPAIITGKYGIQLYTVRNDLLKDMEGTLGYLSKAGYTQVEAYGFKDEKTYWGNKPAKEIKQSLDANQLTSPSGHYDMKGFIYEGNVDEWKQAVEAATILGNKYMVIPWLDENHRSPDFYKGLVDKVNTAAELTKAAGMQLAYHNHEFEFDKGPDGITYLESLLSQTDPKMVEFELDLYWTTFAGYNPIDLFHKYPGRFTMWHLKDRPANANGQKKFVPVGEGVVDFTSIFKKKKLAGLKYAFVEQDECELSSVKECVEKSIANIKKNNWGNE